MSILKFFKKYQLIIFLVFLVVIMLMIKLTYKENSSVDEKQNKISTPISTPTPTPLLIPIQNENFNEINPDYPLESLLPYKTENFVVQRYKSPMVLEIELLKGEKNKAEEEVKVWVEEIMEDKNTHAFVWIN